MIRYDNLSPNDFINYWSGCTVFEYQRDGTVIGHHIGNDVSNSDGYSLDESTVEYGYIDLHHEGSIENVPIADLFDLPKYITHRFQLGYVATAPDRLVHIGIEPNNRRMRKGTSFESLHAHGIVCNGLSMADPLAPKVRDTLLGRVAHSTEDELVMGGIADVLSYGHPACMRQNVDVARATVKTKTLTRQMLSGELTRKVLVPDFSTAIVGHRSKDHVATVLQHGVFVGTLRLTSTGVVELTASTRKYEDRAARKLARVALEQRAKKLYADEIRWTA